MSLLGNELINFLFGFISASIIFLIIIGKYYVRVSNKIARINGRSVKETGLEAISSFSHLLFRCQEENIENKTLIEWYGSYNFKELWQPNLTKLKVEQLAKELD